MVDYMTKSFTKNKRVSRTSEGLVAHHKAEDKMMLLSNKSFAERYPYEWQKKENIVYCDYLEHLLLHVLICKYPSPEKIAYGVGQRPVLRSKTAAERSERPPVYYKKVVILL